EAVVDDDHRAIAQRGKGAIAAIGTLAAVELEALARGDLFDERSGNGELADEVFAEHADAVARDRAHGQLGMRRHAELADEDHVERRTERAGDFERDWDAA